MTEIKIHWQEQLKKGRFVLIHSLGYSPSGQGNWGGNLEQTVTWSLGRGSQEEKRNECMLLLKDLSPLTQFRILVKGMLPPTMGRSFHFT